MKRILLLSPQPFFLSRGTPINVKAMVETLGGEGYAVDLLSFPFGKELDLENVNLLRSPGIPGIHSVPIGPSWRKIVLDIPFTLHALYLVCTKKYDVIHGIEEAGCVAGILGLITGKPFVYDMDSCMTTQLRDSGFLNIPFLLKIVDRIESFFIRKSAAVLTVCSALSEKAKNKALESSKVFQIEDFPYEPATKFDVKTVERIKKEFSLNKKSVALYTGNLEKYQGIDFLLESFAKFPESLEALLVIVGGDVESVENLQNKADALGIKERVVFCGQRPPEEMGAFMQAAEVLVSPRTKGENTPLKIYSYMAAGKVIVATDIHSHTQVLSEEIAFLAKPNAESFSIALREALEDKVEASSRASKAKKLVDTRYSFKEFKRRLLEMYAEILGEAKVGKSNELVSGVKIGNRE